MESTDTYETKDWVEASICFANGLRLVDLKRNASCYFIFHDRQVAESLIECYWRGDLEMNVRRFVDAQKRVKDLIHRDGQKYGNGIVYATSHR